MPPGHSVVEVRGGRLCLRSKLETEAPCEKAMSNPALPNSRACASMAESAAEPATPKVTCRLGKEQGVGV